MIVPPECGESVQDIQKERADETEVVWWGLVESGGQVSDDAGGAKTDFAAADCHRATQSPETLQFQLVPSPPPSGPTPSILPILVAFLLVLPQADRSEERAMFWKQR